MTYFTVRSVAMPYFCPLDEDDLDVLTERISKCSEDPHERCITLANYGWVEYVFL